MRDIHTPALSHGVIAGLDPAIHGAGSTMDARVKLGHDSQTLF
jgi:hypothetical protein